MPLPSGASLPPIFINALQPVEMPPGRDSWVIQVVTRGGFAGRGKGDLIITSQGNVLCNPSNESCPKAIPKDALESLTQIVVSAKTDDINESSLSSCRDCYATLLALYKRGRDGMEQKYIVYWDDATLAEVSKDIRQVYESVVRIAGGRNKYSCVPYRRTRHNNGMHPTPLHGAFHES